MRTNGIAKQTDSDQTMPLWNSQEFKSAARSKENGIAVQRGHHG
jgi:hypothetical protein